MVMPLCQNLSVQSKGKHVYVIPSLNIGFPALYDSPPDVMVKGYGVIGSNA